MKKGVKIISILKIQDLLNQNHCTLLNQNLEEFSSLEKPFPLIALSSYHDMDFKDTTASRKAV